MPDRGCRWPEADLQLQADLVPLAARATDHEEEVLHRVVGDEEVQLAVLVDVGGDHAEGLAEGALDVDARIAVPGRMTVTGFDDVAVAGDLAPGLTTIRLPMADMGARALALALKEPGARPRKQKVKAELVVRGSSGSAVG